MRKNIFIIGIFICLFALQPWAMAAEIKMTRSRLGWMASAEEVRYRLNRSL